MDINLLYVEQQNVLCLGGMKTKMIFIEKSLSKVFLHDWAAVVSSGGAHAASKLACLVIL